MLPLRSSRSARLFLGMLLTAPFAHAQMITEGFTRGYYPLGSVQTAGNQDPVFNVTPEAVGYYNNTTILWGTSTNSDLIPPEWRNRRNTVLFSESVFGAVPAATPFKIGTITYQNGTTVNGSNISGFDLSIQFSITTALFSTVFAIPVSFNTISVSDFDAPPATIAGIGYVGQTLDGFFVSPNQVYGNAWNNPDYLQIILPQNPLSHTVTFNEMYYRYTFDGFGLGTADDLTFFVGEGASAQVDLFASYIIDITPVPEPSSFGILGAGVLVGLTLAQRRKLRKAL